MTDNIHGWDYMYCHFFPPFYPYLSKFLQAWHLTGFLKLKCVWRPKVSGEVIVEWVLPLWCLLSLGSRNSRIVNWYSTLVIWSLNFSLCIQEKNQCTAVGCSGNKLAQYHAYLLRTKTCTKTPHPPHPWVTKWPVLDNQKESKHS